MKILIVDDQPAILALLDRVLRTRGFKPLPAATLGDAISTARGADVHGVVLDLALGDRSGLDFLIWMRADTRYMATPVLVFTGTRILPHHEELLHRARAHVVYKPASPRAVIDTLERLVMASADRRPAHS